MKQLKCPECNKFLKRGKFCLDCGTTLIEVESTNVKFKRIESKKPLDDIKKSVRTWLTRIGIEQSDIKILTPDNMTATVEYILKGQSYTFSSHLQDSYKNNLSAVEIFIHGRVIGIERGIETSEQAFKGYEQIPDYTAGERDPWQVLGIAPETSKKLSDENIRDLAEAKYKEIAKKCHPDKNKSSEATNQFREINEAIKKIREMK